MSADLVIVGTGPAGVSAALWARTFGLEMVLIDAAGRVGGQLQFIRFHPAEVLGIPEGDGVEIAALYARQLAAIGVAPRLGLEAQGLEAGGHGVVVRARGGESVAARAALIATGLRRRRLEVPGETELEGRGVSYSARQERERFAGRDAIVVGGGDGAYANAMLLSEVGCRVTIVARRASRARAEFRAQVAADPRIEVLERARVVAFLGGAALEAVEIEREGGEIRERRAVALAVIKIGMLPNTEWCASLARDAEGYLSADVRGRTSLAHVWAAGDVVRPLLPSIAVAAGSAAIAMADLRAVLRGS